MRFSIKLLVVTILLTAGAPDDATARGFGGGRVGGGGGFARGGGFAGRGSFGGGFAGSHVSGAHYGPAGGFNAGGARQGTYVGPRGTTVQHGAIGGVGQGPLGGFHAGGASGTRVTGPEGHTAMTGRHGGIAAGPFGGVAAGGGRGAAVSGPEGSAAIGRRGGVAVGPGGGITAGGARGAAVEGRYGGAAAIGRRGGVAVGPAGGIAAGGTRGGAAVGPWGGGSAWRHSTGYVSPTWLNDRGAYVRSSFRYDVFNPGWYTAHPGAWFAAGWAASDIWHAPVWSSFVPWVGVAAEPVSYDYGTTTVIHDNTVYVEGEPVASTEEYADQATAIADQGRQEEASPDEEWKPLGVFGMIQGDEQVAQHIFQLAVNKDGVVRGSYYDAIADNTLPVYGSVDKKTQRIAWSIGEKKTVVFEAGLVNLTKEQTTILVHYGKDNTQQMVLVRLEQPGDSSKADAATP